MELKEILTISGKSGLFRLVSNNRSTFIVESLNDGKRFPAFARDKVSPLEEISIFTNEDDMPLKEVFLKLYDFNGKAPVDAEVYGNNDKLKQLFEDFVPDYDHDRVYVSHMKKIVSWYNDLVAHEVLENELNSSDDEEDTKNDEGALQLKNNDNKPNMSELKKTNVNTQMPKNATSKAQSRSITTKPKAK